MTEFDVNINQTYTMFTITVSDELRNACPDFRGAAILASVENTKE